MPCQREEILLHQGAPAWGHLVVTALEVGVSHADRRMDLGSAALCLSLPSVRVLLRPVGMTNY